MSKTLQLILSLMLSVLLLAGCNIPGIQTNSADETQMENHEVVPLVEASVTPLPSETAESTTAVPEVEIAAEEGELTPVISIDNLEQLQIVRQTTVEYPYRIKWFSDGSRLGVIVDQNLLFLDGETLENMGSVEIETPYMLLDFSSTEAVMAVTKDRTSFELRSTETGEVVREIIPPVQIIGALFSPDGKYIAANTIDELSVIFWDLESGEIYKILKGFETAAPVYHFVFSQDGKNIIWVSRGKVQPMSIEDEVLGPALYHEDFVNGVALDPAGEILAASAAGMVGEDYLPLIVRWALPEGEQIDKLVSGEKSVLSLLYSADGQLLFSGGSSLDIWYGEDSVYKLYTSDPDQISSIALSEDGRKLAAATSEGNFLLWKVIP